MCKSARGTLRHVLSSCGSSLQMYTWRHNRVLAILDEITETQGGGQRAAYPRPKTMHQFPPRRGPKPQGQKFLAAARDWKMAADLKEALHFPHHIAHTQEWPDIVIWSDTVKRVIIVELTVPWEENMEEAFERKKLRYENLRMECEDKGWARQVMPIEVGCCGFIGRTTTSYLTRLGLTNRARRRATQQLQTAAERASSWIWSKVRKSTTAWQNRPPSSLLPYPHPTPPQPHPSPTLSLPLPTTSIPIPSSAYRASRSTCSPQWHHPVAEAAGGARVWGTTGSRRNHLTRSGRWLTRVMSRQLLLHVVRIYSHCVIPSLAQFPLFQLCKHAVFARILMILWVITGAMGITPPRVAAMVESVLADPSRWLDYSATNIWIMWFQWTHPGPSISWMLWMALQPTPL